MKNAMATESDAFEALDAYLGAAEDVIALYNTEDCHAECVYRAFCYGCSAPVGQESHDRPCERTLSRFGHAAYQAFGGGHSRWFGAVFGWVTKGDNAEVEQERIQRIDEFMVSNLERLWRENPENPIVPLVLRQYRGERWSACCREVTTFLDWYDTQNFIVSPERIESPASRLVQMGIALETHGGLMNRDEWPAEQAKRLNALISSSVNCDEVSVETKKVKYGELRSFHTLEGCSLGVTSVGNIGDAIREYCGY